MKFGISTLNWKIGRLTVIRSTFEDYVMSLLMSRAWCFYSAWWQENWDIWWKLYKQDFLIVKLRGNLPEANGSVCGLNSNLKVEIFEIMGMLWMGAMSLFVGDTIGRIARKILK